MSHYVGPCRFLPAPSVNLGSSIRVPDMTTNVCCESLIQGCHCYGFHACKAYSRGQPTNTMSDIMPRGHNPHGLRAKMASNVSKNTLVGWDFATTPAVGFGTLRDNCLKPGPPGIVLYHAPPQALRSPLQINNRMSSQASRELKERKQGSVPSLQAEDA